MWVKTQEGVLTNLRRIDDVDIKSGKNYVKVIAQCFRGGKECDKVLGSYDSEEDAQSAKKGLYRSMESGAKVFAMPK